MRNEVDYMQERVNEKTVGIAVQATKMTARILARVASAYVHHVKEKRREKAVDKRNDPARYKHNQAGKVKIKTLMKEGDGISNVEIKDDNIRVFERLARKNGIRYAIKKDRSTQPPTFYIFFKGKNAEVIEATLREFTKTKLTKPAKHPIHDRLKKYKERVREAAAVIAKDRNKDKVR
jgi:hypothetical protein